MSDDLFNEKETSVTETKPEDPGNQATIDQLVGEGKKYKTVEDLARSRVEADQFIERLKGETAEMRQTIAEMQEKYESILNAQREGDGNATTKEQVKPEELVELVDQRLRDLEAQNTAEANMNTSTNELLTHFEGDMERAKAFLQKRATELGVDVAYLKSQAAKSPTVFKTLVGTPQNAPAGKGHSAASIPSSGHGGAGSGVRAGTKEYYQALRKENPKEYFSPRVQNEMMALMREGKLRMN